MAELLEYCLTNGSSFWFSENDVVVKKYDTMAQESLSLKLRRKSMNDDLTMRDIESSNDVDDSITEGETITRSCDPLEERQPRSDQGHQSILRPELAGLCRFSNLYKLEVEESFLNDGLTVSYRGGIPKKNCSGTFDHFSSRSTDDDLSLSRRFGTPKGECSPMSSYCSSPALSPKNGINFGSSSHDRCLRAMIIAEKLSSMHNDGIHMLKNVKEEKDLSMTEPTTGVNTASVTRRNSIDETIILE